MAQQFSRFMVSKGENVTLHCRERMMKYCFSVCASAMSKTRVGAVDTVGLLVVEEPSKFSSCPSRSHSCESRVLHTSCTTVSRGESPSHRLLTALPGCVCYFRDAEELVAFRRPWFSSAPCSICRGVASSQPPPLQHHHHHHHHNPQY